jgi:hypothetical protein
MKRWALLTVVLYAMALAVSLWLGFVMLYLDYQRNPYYDKTQSPLELGLQAFASPPVSIWLGVMVLSQAALLVFPVRISQGRPVTKTWIFWPILAAGVATVVLVLGMGLVFMEILAYALSQGKEEANGWTGEYWYISAIIMAVVIVFWVVWAFIFGFYAGRSEPKDLMGKIVRWLLAGSILELLIAIPAHVYARSKNDCCGGLGTVWGLAAGTAVMLFAFGPGVFMLFVRRVKSLEPERKPAEDTSEIPPE